MRQRIEPIVEMRRLLPLAEAEQDGVLLDVMDEARKTICEILRDQIGHDFSGYKEKTFLRRVQRRTHRPMLVNDPEGTLRRLMDARYATYATADVTVEARDVPHEQMVNEIIDRVHAHVSKAQAVPPPTPEGSSQS